MLLVIADIELKSIEENLIDLIWEVQPARQFNPIKFLDPTISGKTLREALEKVRERMAENHVDLLVLTALDEIACNISYSKT